MISLPCSNADQRSAARQQQRVAGGQRGSIAVMAVIFLSVMIILLSSIDIGYLFYMKRDLQKAVDLAALAGAQQLVSTPLAGNPTGCAATDAPVLAAIGNAQTNGFTIVASNVTCGYWDPANNSAPSYFSTSATASVVSLNAVKVVVTQTVPIFFGLLPNTISAQAIASGTTPIAAFSLGTGLLSLCSSNSALLAPLLTGLNGSSLCLSAVSSSGLVGAQISLLQLLNNLGVSVGSVSEVANIKVTLLQLINASISALTPAQQASITTDLGPLITLAGSTQFTLGKILNLDTSNGLSALNAQVNVLDLLNVGTLQVANGNNFVDLGASVPGLVGVKLALIQPPQIAVGPVGTTATSAQLRLAINVASVSLGVVSTSSLPIYVDLAAGQATLEGVQCNASPRSATFNVSTGIADVCMATGQGVLPPPTCPNVSQPANQVGVSLNTILGNIGLLKVGIKVPVTNPVATSVTLNVPPQAPSTATINSSLGAILGQIIQPNTIAVSDPTGLLGGLLTALLSGLGAILNPILGGIGSILDSVLSLLGIGIGQSTLSLSSVTCGNVKLVY
ncbi:TadG family pilus assembly protein [Glaciimonas soli]|nr:TadG family pilus assembly protein [Glaciimonas soli]